MKTKYVTIKDIVIPKGTVFNIAPTQVKRCTTHHEATIGLSKDTAGSFTYDLEDLKDSDLKEFFTELKEYDYGN